MCFDLKALEEKIISDGIVLEGNVLKVGSFLNQQIDTDLLVKMADEVSKIYSGCKITKVLTVEASGIALAAAVGIRLSLPVVFAKKTLSSNVTGEVYTALVHSYTHGSDNNITVPKNYINSDDKVLIIDDFLAMGEAFEGLVSLCKQAGAEVVGCTAAVEKGFQGGSDKLRSEGVRVESLAVIDKMSVDGIVFGCN